MRVDIDNIVRLLSSKIPSGIINLKMESHRHELLQILNELYDSDTANNIIVTVEQLHSDTPVIVEADGDSKSTQSIAASITKTAKSDIKKGKEDSSGDGKDGKKSDGDKKSSVKARTIAPPPKVKPAIVKVVPIKPKTEYKRDKTLGNIDRNFFRRSNLETRVEFEAKLKQSDMFKRIPVKEPFHLKTPSSFPPRYTEILERMFMTEKYDNYNPPISFFCSTGGSGLISAQASELLMLAFVCTKSKSTRLAIHSDILAYLKTIPKDSRSIIDESWAQAAVDQSNSLHARLRYLHPKGYDIEQVAWDVEADVTALGLRDYKMNKEHSTDVYIRVKPVDGDVYLLEDSLKKDTAVFLLNTSVNEISQFAVKKLDDDVQHEYHELKYKCKYVDTTSNEQMKLRKRILQIEADAIQHVDDSINPTTFKSMQYDSGIAVGKLYEKIITTDRDGNRLTPKINDDALAKTFGDDKQKIRFFNGAMNALKYGEIGSKEYADALGKFNGKRSGKIYILKSVVFIGEYIASTGDGNIRIALDDHYEIARSFQREYLNGIASDVSLMNGLLDKIDTAFPLKSLYAGTQQADIGSLPIFRKCLVNVFKTKTYDELRCSLIIRKNSRAEYELVYATANDQEVIPIATVYTRQRGVGYEQNIALEMRLHPKFTQRVAKSNAELGIMTSEIERQLSLMAK